MVGSAITPAFTLSVRRLIPKRRVIPPCCVISPNLPHSHCCCPAWRPMSVFYLSCWKLKYRFIPPTSPSNLFFTSVHHVIPFFLLKASGLLFGCDSSFSAVQNTNNSSTLALKLNHYSIQHQINQPGHGFLTFAKLSITVMVMFTWIRYKRWLGLFQSLYLNPARRWSSCNLRANGFSSSKDHSKVSLSKTLTCCMAASTISVWMWTCEPTL